MAARPFDDATPPPIQGLVGSGQRFAAPSNLNSAFRPDADSHQSRALRGTDARRSNLSMVLQCLYDQPDLSRAEVARRTGLTRAAVSELVGVLVEDGLVAETGRGSGAQVGKPAIMLGIRDVLDIVTLDLSAPSEIVGAVHSLRGKRRHTISLPLRGATGQAAIDLVRELTDQLLAAAGNPVLGIGVGSPGTIDSNGEVLISRAFGWHHVPLQEMLHQHTGLPVAVVNDANAAVVAEQAFANGPSNLLRVQITQGVGAGLLLGGQLWVGTSAAAGEIGHLVVEYKGQKCLCGKHGCLETWASVSALAHRIAANPGQRDTILAEGGRRLGMALVCTLATLDIDDVVLGGPPDLINGAFARAAQDLINARLHSEFRDPVRLRPSTLGADATMLGGVAMVLRTTLGIW